MPEDVKTEATPQTDEPEAKSAEVSEEVVEEPKEEVVEKPKDDDNVERSRLGRRLSAMEKQMEAFMNEMRVAVVAPRASAEETFTVDEDVPLTLKDLRRLEKDKAEAQKEYNNTYVRSIYKLGEEEDDATLSSILNLLDTKYKSIYSQDAASDAERNYFKAAKEVYKMKARGSEKVDPFKGNASKSPKGLGVSAGTKSPIKNVKPIELDSFAEEYRKAVGLSEEDVARALETKSDEVVAGSTSMAVIKERKSK